MALLLPLRARALGSVYFAVLEQPTARSAGFEPGLVRPAARTGTTGLLDGVTAQVEVLTATRPPSDPPGEPTGDSVEVVVDGRRLGRFAVTRTLRPWPWDGPRSHRAAADRPRPSWRLKVRPSPRRFVAVESDHPFGSRLNLESFPASTVVSSTGGRRESGSTAAYEESPAGTIRRPPWAVTP